MEPVDRRLSDLPEAGLHPQHCTEQTIRQTQQQTRKLHNLEEAGGSFERKQPGRRQSRKATLTASVGGSVCWLINRTAVFSAGGGEKRNEE